MVWLSQSGIPGYEIRGFDPSGCAFCQACALARKHGYIDVIMDKCEPEAQSLLQNVPQSVLGMVSRVNVYFPDIVLLKNNFPLQIDSVFFVENHI